MNRSGVRAFWIASATAPKPAGKPRPEPWETSRKCSHGHVNEILFELRGGNGPPPRNSAQRPVASARLGTSVYANAFFTGNRATSTARDVAGNLKLLNRPSDSVHARESRLRSLHLAALRA